MRVPDRRMICIIASCFMPVYSPGVYAYGGVDVQHINDEGTVYLADKNIPDIDRKFYCEPAPQERAYDAKMRAETPAVFSNWDIFQLPGNVKAASVMEYGNRIYALCPGAVFVSADAGVSWNRINAQSGIANNLFFSVISRDGQSAPGPQRVLLSINAATAAQQRSGGAPAERIRVYSLCNLWRNQYAATENGMYVSIDNGTTWAPSNNGLPAGSGGENIPRGALIAAIDNILFATVNGKVFRSDNYGSRWEELKSGEYYEDDVQSLAAIGKTLFAARGRRGITVSFDMGKSWKRSGPDKESDIYVRYPDKGPADIADMAALGPNLFVVTSKGIVYASTDNGAGWIRTTGGLPGECTVTALSSAGKHLYAWSKDGDVYRLRNLNY